MRACAGEVYDLCKSDYDCLDDSEKGSGYQQILKREDLGEDLHLYASELHRQALRDDAVKKFGEVGLAYKVLRDVDLRRIYLSCGWKGLVQAVRLVLAGPMQQMSQSSCLDMVALQSLYSWRMLNAFTQSYFLVLVLLSHVPLGCVPRIWRSRRSRHSCERWWLLSKAANRLLRTSALTTARACGA